MSDDEVLELAVDIQRRGLVSPIVLFEGRLLDGRARLRACEIAGVKPTFVEWTPCFAGAKAAEGPGMWAFHVNALTRRLRRADRRALLSRVRRILEDGRRRDAAPAVAPGATSVVAPAAAVDKAIPQQVDAPRSAVRIADAVATSNVVPIMPPRAPRIRTETVLVTPEMAMKWLERNVVNRPLDKRRVEEIAWDIRRDKWDLTHQSIGINVFGDLIDGQHRLRAVIAAGIAIMMRVTYDVEAVFGSAIDTGGPRKASDILRLSPRHVSICNALSRLQGRGRGRDSAARVGAVYEHHREDIDWALRTFPQQRGITANVIAAHAFAHPAP